jgi:hypothetical protein
VVPLILMILGFVGGTIFGAISLHAFNTFCASIFDWIAIKVFKYPHPYVRPSDGWTCYHCGETFRSWSSARDHFGADEFDAVACRIKSREERGLLKALRKSEALAEEFHERAVRAEDREEALTGQLSDFKSVTKFEDANEIRNHLDCLDGIRITQEALIKAVMEKAPEVYAEVVR